MNNPKPPIELKRLFGQTWNPEIIISTFGVIAIIQSLPFIRNLFDQMFSDFGFFGESFYIKNGLIMPFYIILLFFTAHIVLRTYWLGIIGLHYAYPKLNSNKIIEESKPNALNVSSLNASNEKIIFTTKLDKICSSVFAWTFIAFFILLGLNFLLIVLVLLKCLVNSLLTRIYLLVFLYLCYVVPGKSSRIFNVLISILLVPITGKVRDKLKRKINKWSVKISHTLVTIFEMITLQFIYRSLINRVIGVFGVLRFRLLFIVMAFLLSLGMILFLFTYTALNQYYEVQINVASSSNYENLRNQNFNYPTISINSDIVDDFLKIKIPLMKVRNEISNLNLISFYTSHIQLKINDSILINPNPLINDEQTLVLTAYLLYYVDVRRIPKGLNKLSVTYPLSINSEKEICDSTRQRTKTIPFWVR